MPIINENMFVIGVKIVVVGVCIGGGHVDGAAGGARARAAAGERRAGAEPAAGARGPRAHAARAPPGYA